MKHTLRVEVFVDGLRVSEADATFDGDWREFDVFVTQGRFQRFLHRIARALCGVAKAVS